jgi:hypothetical protein
MATLQGSPPVNSEVVQAVSAATAKRHSVVYSGERQYRIQNHRFGQTANANSTRELSSL